MKMKKYVRPMLAGFVFAAMASASQAADRSIGLLAVGNVSAQELQEVKAHMEIYLPMRIEILDARAPLGAQTLEEEAAALTALAEGRYGVIGIVSAAEEIPTFGVFLPAEQTAVMNETAIGQEQEKRLPRFKKEAMRCAGLMLGLKPGPDTRCCMWHYTDLAGLDHKGGNFSPPLLVQLMNMYPDWRPGFIVGADEWEAEVEAESEEVEAPAAAEEPGAAGDALDAGELPAPAEEPAALSL